LLDVGDTAAGDPSPAKSQAQLRLKWTHLAPLRWLRQLLAAKGSNAPGETAISGPSVEYQRRNAKAKAAHDAKYRALKRGSIGAEKFTLDEIFERDNQTCYLCGKAVTRRDATMDHVIPITKGGPHTRANVKLAHRGCNARKSDRILPD